MRRRVNYMKNMKKKINNYFCILKVIEERSRIRGWIRIIGQSYGPADPDPHQNVTDPQHCCQPMRSACSPALPVI
jgi:hypothetical protein